MDAQRRYWQEFADLKRDALYISFYHAKDEKIDRYLNIISAVASSSSIGGWVIWQKVALFWASVIAISQVLSAVKEYLPYKARLKGLSTLGHDLSALALSAENDWFKISHGMLTEKEVHDLYINLKEKIQHAVKNSFPNSSLPEVKSLLEKAESSTQLYLRRYLSGE